MASTLEEIEKAIVALPQEELRQLRSWFETMDTEEWDAQIERDATAGKLDDLANAALAEHAQGKTRKL